MQRQHKSSNARPADRAKIKQFVKTSKAILPPFGKLVDDFKQESGLIVCTGSNGWQNSKSKTWISGMPKVVLPFGDSPSLYKWPANNRTVMICNFGQSENYQKLIELSKCLLKHGAIWVLWVMKDYPMTKIERPRMEVAA